jgi:hypothetical protein
MIIGGIILSSVIFVEWKSMDKEHYLETYEILTELSQKEMNVNQEFGTYGGEITYFHWMRLHDVDVFPILKKELPQSKITYTLRTQLYGEDVMRDQKAQEYHNIEINNLRDYFQVLEKQKITHLILDQVVIGQLINDELRLHLRDIFSHENKYPFLVKEYDSKENGFNYHVKLFKIDYDLYNDWINEN